MFKAQEVMKGKFWIIYENEVKIGTVRSIATKSSSSEAYEYYDQRTNEKKILNSMKELFKVSTRDNVAVKEESVLIAGYDSGTSKAFPAGMQDSIPLFKKTQNAKSLYAAGYYIVKFHGMGWQWAKAPKLSTLTKYIYRGPYYTEWEMMQDLKKQRRQGVNEKVVPPTNS